MAALIVLVAILAACTPTDPRLEDEPESPASAQGIAPVQGERLVILSGADATLPADETADLVIVFNSTARIEGQASAIVVVNGAADLVGARADRIVAIQSDVAIDPASKVSGDIRTFESSVTGGTAATVPGGIREFGLDMLLDWRLGAALILFYIAFAVSALMAGVVLAGLAGRQVRAAGALITKEPAMVVGAAFVGLIALLAAGILTMVTVVGIPFAIGVLGLVLPGLFVIGYIVTGIWFGELILGQSSPVVRERPYLAAVIGLSIVGLVGWFPMVGGLISFVGFGAVMLLSWRVLRGAPGATPYPVGIGPVAEAAS
jgi:hypothetical protein